MNLRALHSGRVRVPATTSNLGAGFDCIGLAVDLWLSASMEPGDNRANGDPPFTVIRSGTLSALDVPPDDDALIVGFKAVCAANREPIPWPLIFKVESEIPVARGLGSSSAALVAGARLADMMFSLDMSTTGLAELCTRIEGHPDNVSPALFGGAMLAVPGAGTDEARSWTFAPLVVHADLAFVFVIPPFPIETSHARAILPDVVPHGVAVRAAGKGAALVQGLATGDGALLTAALDDVLHVPYRLQLIPGLSDLQDAARGAGAFGATISGAGSTLLAIAPQDAAARVADAMQRRWSARGIEASTHIQRRPAKTVPAVRDRAR